MIHQHLAGAALNSFHKLLHAICGRWGVQVDSLAANLVIELPKRRDVVENPKGPAMGGQDQIVVLNHQVVSDRSHALGLATEAFVRHLRYLRRHYRLVSLDEAVEYAAKCPVARVGAMEVRPIFQM